MRDRQIIPPYETWLHENSEAKTLEIAGRIEYVSRPEESNGEYGWACSWE